MVHRVHVSFTVGGGRMPLGMPAAEGCLKDGLVHLSHVSVLF